MQLIPGKCQFCRKELSAGFVAPIAVEKFGREIASTELAGVVCDDCVSAAIDGEAAAGDDLCDALVKDLFPQIARITGEMPWAGWRSALHKPLNKNQDLLALLKIGYRLPPDIHIETVYGGWLTVLEIAGFMDVKLPSSRGYRSTANDGHECFSNGERLIDDWLHANGVVHDREPVYPGTKYRGDFLVNGKFVEYFGLVGNPEYESRRALKSAAATKAGIEVVSIYPVDVTNWKSHQGRIADELGMAVTTPLAVPRTRPTSTSFLPNPRLAPQNEGQDQEAYSVALGYYPDPFGGGALRFNNGSAWTYLVVDDKGRSKSHTPGVTPEIRNRIENRFRLSARTEIRGGSAADRWAEGLRERVLDSVVPGPRLPKLS